MINAIVLSHGTLAQALVATAFDLVGVRPGVIAVGLSEGESTEAYAARLSAAAGRLPPGDLLLLCDLAGGTPQRAAVELARGLRGRRACAVVTGVNLGMLCEALLASADAVGPQALADQVTRAAAREMGVLHLSDVDSA